jgi:hypothetical protein
MNPFVADPDAVFTEVLVSVGDFDFIQVCAEWRHL